jgi:hypothetical protein
MSKKKDGVYYAEIRICGFSDKKALTRAIRDAVEQIDHYCVYSHRVVEVEMERCSLLSWIPIKLPKKLRKLLGEK